MDIFMKTLDIIGTSIDHIFIGYCRCVSHCFKFVQLLGMLVECIIGIIMTLIKYNNLFFSTCFNYTSDIITYIQGIPRKFVVTMEYVLNEIIIGIPVATVNYMGESIAYGFSNFKENINEYITSFVTYCQVVLPLICNTFVNLAANICNIPYKLLCKIFNTASDYLDSSILLIQSAFVWLAGVVSSCYTSVISSLEFTFDFFASTMISDFSISAISISIWENVIYGSKVTGTYIASTFPYFMLKLCNVFSTLLNGVKCALDFMAAVLFEGTIYLLNGVKCALDFMAAALFEGTIYLLNGVKCALDLMAAVLFEGTICVCQFTEYIFDKVLYTCKALYSVINTETTITIVLLISSSLLLRIIYFNCPAIFHFLRKLLSRSKQGVIHYLEVLKSRGVFGQSVLSNSNLDDEPVKTYCAVCHDHDKTVVLMPCRHLCLCIICYRRIMRMRLSLRICPMCRVRIDDFISVYM